MPIFRHVCHNCQYEQDADTLTQLCISCGIGCIPDDLHVVEEVFTPEAFAEGIRSVNVETDLSTEVSGIVWNDE